jgi:hypothetical protein
VLLFGEGGGRAVVALPRDQVEVAPIGGGIELRRIGSVGGDSVFGFGVGDLRRVWGGE